MIVLVGEMNPHGSVERYALYPLPKTGSGGRLARILGLTAREYLRRYPIRRNLCTLTQEWDAHEAIHRAEDIRLAFYGEPLVLLGAKVALAFGVPYRPFTRHGRFLILPHPSGRCRYWNDPRNVTRARRMVRAMEAE